MNDDDRLQRKLAQLLPLLNESQSRKYLAIEAEFIGRGGKTKLTKLAKVSPNTIAKGKKEIKSGIVKSTDGRIRSSGAGRKKKITDSVWTKIQSFIEPHTRGEPQNPLQWLSKSLRNIEAALKEKGVNVSHRIIGESLKSNGFSLQANRKTHEGKGHEDRDLQFEFINKKVEEFMKNDQPVVSVDAKKRELIGNFKNQGSVWSPEGSPINVNAYDFLTEAEGVAIPYGIYDVTCNKGWVNVGITKDTAEFAVQSLSNWWYKMGIYHHNKATALLVMADGGGSNSSKGKLWKYELQKFSDDTGLSVQVLHFPPGTSKWNKIEHRLFSHISKNWRGRPLVSYKVIVNMIASTKTTKGLAVDCELDESNYETGIRITETQMESVNIIRNKFHGEWNYEITPNI